MQRRWKNREALQSEFLFCPIGVMLLFKILSYQLISMSTNHFRVLMQVNWLECSIIHNFHTNLNLELIYFYYLFFHRRPIQLSTAKARRRKKLQHPTRPIENVAITTKGLRKENTTIEWNDGGKIGNQNKLILTQIFPSLHET